ncbi:hypothetical protein G6M89_20085 [Natronolimnobius sp. AArcel1]|uniref:Bug family tripartite tricarboxylate transporter substrate binding protein n=1 Tax=Natronolimnobius sp. AArcel1 TaxID=1679093 RepID=UPI0013E9EBBF|nr:tripartite tricarboxylate transporter substrate-binding protein [Natronolimnobius sp. AArcel1]NGM71273.1 hypothetical protein [Natronolimnobius sp. AArcel1]
MPENFSRRTFLKGTAGASGTAVAVSLAGCTGADEGFPSDTIEFVNHYSEGGGTDTNFREIEPHWEEEIGGSFSQTYEDGAGTRNGVNTVVGEDDLYTVGGTLTPATPSTIPADEEDENREPAFSVDDLEFLGTTVGDPALIRIREDDGRFDTLEELIAYAEDNPGELTMGSSGPVNQFTLAGVQLFDELDLDDIDIVPYDGGGPVQTGLLQEEVDFIIRAVYNSRDIEDETTVVGIFAEDNEWSEITDDAEPVNDVLETNIEYDPLSGFETYYVSMDAAEAEPDEYEQLVDSFQVAMESDDYRTDLADVDEFEPEKVDVRSPDETREIWEDAVDAFRAEQDLIEQYIQE